MANSEAHKNSTATFQDVKARVDLIDFIAHVSGSTPKRVGVQTFFNPCPLCSHNDCFVVYGEARNSYKCHSCSSAGDVFNFAQECLALDKAGALREVAAFAGVELPALGRDASAPENPLQKVLEAAVTHFRQALAGRADIMAWLTTLKPDGRAHQQKTLDLLEVGMADGRLAEALQAQGFALEQIKAAGLFVESRKKPGEWHDFFARDLVIFPHRLGSGEVAHFTLKDPRKKLDYQYKAEHRLSGFAWGNQKAIRAESLILCEGENDLASFFDAGMRNVLASLGGVTDEQLRWLDTHAAGKKIYCWFDYDTKYGDNGQPPAGLRYTRKIYQRLMRNADCQVLVVSALMDPGEDPDDWIHKDLETAPKRIQAALKKAHNPLLWELRVMPADIRADADAALRYLEELDFFDYLGLLGELQRDAVVVEMQKLGFSRDAVLENIKHGYDLCEQLQKLTEDYSGSLKGEPYMRLFSMQIWDHFKTKGKFFVSGEKLHLFYHNTIYSIGDNTPFKSLMHRETGINYTVPLAKFVWEEMKALCFSRGDRLSEFGWISLLNSADGASLYFNLKDPANRILRVSRGSVDLAENGTNEHNVLLAQSNQMKPFNYDPEVNIHTAMRELKTLVLDNLSCEPAQRYLVLAWALSAFLLPLSESRALMKMEGVSGSGKTTAAKFISLLLYGENMVGRSSTASDYSMASSEPLIIKDNLETDDINRNALNFLLLAATGATNIKRQQGTESGVVTEKINCLVAITSIEPFNKPELINRAFLIDFTKRWQRRNFVETDAVQNLTAKRDAIVSAWLQLLAEKVLPSLDDRGRIIAYIKDQHRDYSKERVTEFTALLVLITRALVKYMPLSEELKLDAGDRAPEYVLLDHWVRYQNEHSRMIEQGTNAVLALLEGLRRSFLIDFSQKAEAHECFVWCPVLGIKAFREALLDPNGYPTGHQVYWFDGSTADVLSMMNRLGREHGVKVPFGNTRQLGVRITNEMATLKLAGWRISALKTIHGNRISRWTWSDAEHTPDCLGEQPNTAPTGASI